MHDALAVFAGGCTKQAVGFNDEAPGLLQAGYKVFGMRYLQSGASVWSTLRSEVCS